MSKGQLWIGNSWIPGDGKRIEVPSPVDGLIRWTGHEASCDQVDHAFKNARKAFDVWGRLSIFDRIVYLERFAASLEKRKEEFVVTISFETGKPHWEALTEVTASIGKIQVSIHAYEERCRQVQVDKEGQIRRTFYRAHGVVAVLGPFNLPLHLPNGQIIPALLAGNVVIFKPSERTPQTAELMMQCWVDAGIPSGVIQLLHGDCSVGNQISENKDLDGLFFVGSAQVGSLLHQKFAGHPEKILALEMGGNNPIIVTEVEDEQAAAYLTIVSAYITSGQRCVCARRLIVPRGRKEDSFLKSLSVMIAKIQVGSPKTRPEPFMGPLISADAAENVIRKQVEWMDLGAQSIHPVIRLGLGPAYLSPGLVDVTPLKERPDEEIFGPLLQLIRVENIEEAIEEANKTRFGLAAGILTDDKDMAQLFMSRAYAGILNWNQPLTGASSEAPFGGVGASGNHRASAWHAADYCAYPVASLSQEKLNMPTKKYPGLKGD